MRRAVGRARSVLAATSLKVMTGRCGSKALMTSKPRAMASMKFGSSSRRGIDGSRVGGCLASTRLLSGGLDAVERNPVGPKCPVYGPPNVQAGAVRHATVATSLTAPDCGRIVAASDLDAVLRTRVRAEPRG